MAVLLLCQYCGKEYKRKPHQVAGSKFCGRSCQTSYNNKANPRIKHGFHKTKIHRLWRSVKGRCSCPTATGFHNYGARGIKVCERWQTFEGFYADVGDIPFPGAELDRIDNNGDYEPGNVQWVDHKTNSQKRRTSRMVDYKGEQLCLLEACERAELKHESVRGRMRKFGLTPQQALDFSIMYPESFKGRSNQVKEIVKSFLETPIDD